MNKLFLSLTLTVLWLTSTLYADLFLGTSSPPSEPLLMAPGATSNSLVVDLVNSIRPDLLTGWQVELRIVPDTGARGTVTFNPNMTGKPDNYIFEGLGTFGGPNFSRPPGLDSIVYLEVTLPFEPVAVPQEPGVNLFSTALDASEDAFGTFGLFAVSGVGSLEWTDDSVNPRNFSNVPPDGENVEIGRVLVGWEPTPLDFSQDRIVGTEDLDALVEQIVSGANGDLFDLSGDGLVDRTDLAEWLSDAGRYNGFQDSYLDGDANLDGTVDASDLNALGLRWQQNAFWSGGDFTTDGFVNAADLNVLAINWQESIVNTADVNMRVPEPSTSLLTVWWAALIWRRWAQSRTERTHKP